MSKCSISDCTKIPKENRKICNMHRSRWKNHKSYSVPIPKIRPYNRRGHSILMVCINHGQLEREQIQFSFSKADGARQDCKKCCRNSENRRKFGITEKDYDDMTIKQNGTCAICRKPETMKRNGKILILAIDHCHKLNEKGIMKVRGLLCAKCNHGLGNFNDDIELLKSAIKY